MTALNIVGSLKTLELLKLYSNLMDELRRREILRTYNNPVAGYGEFLACKALSLTPARNSEKGFDAVDGDGNKYEVKTRRVAQGSTPTRLSSLRQIDEHLFDYVIEIIFDEDFIVKRAIQIPYESVRQKAKFQSHTNAWILRVYAFKVDDPSVKDLTGIFRNVQNYEEN